MKISSIGLCAASILLSTVAFAQTSVQVQQGYVCPVPRAASKEDQDRVRVAVTEALNKAFDAAIGPDANRLHEDDVFARVAARRIDEQRMAALASVSGCAALLDQPYGCPAYFGTEVGNPLSVFMSMKKKAPLRKQFEAAVARIPNPGMRRAALDCIKKTGSHD